MLVVIGIAKICCWALNCMLFVCLIGIFVKIVIDRHVSAAVGLMMFGGLIFFFRVRLGHFLYETEVITYRHEGVLSRYYPWNYIDLISLIVTFSMLIVSGVLYAYAEWWVE